MRIPKKDKANENVPPKPTPINMILITISQPIVVMESKTYPIRLHAQIPIATICCDRKRAAIIGTKKLAGNPINWQKDRNHPAVSLVTPLFM